ncbi:MAG: alpha/beta fold hydrolase [Desulfobacteraceae bacterium]|nr:MAG: alpha/beta fold hydrolase [Desulfobacteraceae bacterium]
METERIKITCKDNEKLSAIRYTPDDSSRAVVIICSALGVPQQFYSGFSIFLAEHGCTVVTFDYRGTGESKNIGLRGRDIMMQDWGQLDMDAVMDEAIQWGMGPIFLVGHSAGGQLFGLSPQSKHLKGVILAPASSANAGLYPFPTRFLFYLMWHLFIPLLAFKRDQFPARKIRLASMDAPSGVMKQWSKWAGNPDYLFSRDSGLDTSRYAELHMPILAYGFSDDKYASEKAIRHLLSRFKSAEIQFHFMDVKQMGIGSVGHFGFFKEKMKTSLWQQTLKWLDSHNQHAK